MNISLNNKKISLNTDKNEINIDYLLKIIKENKKIIAYKINRVFFDLNNVASIKENDDVVLIYDDSEEAKNIYNHSTAHLLAHSIHRLYPKALFTIGPSIENGFYYDIDFGDDILSENDFEKIENEMHKISNEKIDIKREIISKNEAIKLFKNNNYKLWLINKIDTEISIYKQKDFIDLCKGPHVPNTSYLKYFKILSLSGSYWLGDSKNKQLTRIYGIAMNNEKKLNEYLELLKKQKEIDHKKIGKNLQLFLFSKYGLGMPFWLPNGLILKNELKKFWIKLHEKNNYLFSETPIMLSKELWVTSGHWKNYKNNMYLTKIENNEFAIKPMNCPGCILIYKNSQHSYRELPIRIGELGIVHRHEASGALNGLFRVREFTQDDAHIFCRSDQMKNEIIKIIKIFDEIYSLFNLKYSIEISTKPNKYIGNIKIWDKSEKILKEACKKCKKNIIINEGNGAFYGPKIDFKIKDSIGRTWQCGTIQLDMNLPQKFKLYYIDKNNKKITPIMLHRAIFGSLERFIGILLEHFNGVLPFWLSPEQIRILPINQLFLKYSKHFFNILKKKDIRVTIDNSEDSLSYRLKKSQINKVPYTIIIGNNEIQKKEVSYRIYGKETQYKTSKKNFLKMICKRIKEKK